MLYPVIDVGSNTVKLAVLDEEKIFSSTPVFFKAVPLCLGASVQNGIMPEKAIKELLDLILDFKAISARLTSTPPLAFATASLRGVENKEEIRVQFLNQAGIDLEIISGEKEAYYSFLGALGNRNVKEGITVDLGGGSTEILAFIEGKVQNSVSLPLGCLSLFNRYFESGNNDIFACRTYIKETLTKAPPLPGKTILLSGGSAKAIAYYKNTLEHKTNLQLTRKQMEAVLWHFLYGTEDEHEKIKSVLKERFRLVPPAVAVFTEILSFYGVKDAQVSRSGVREGFLKSYLSEKN